MQDDGFKVEIEIGIEEMGILAIKALVFTIYGYIQIVDGMINNETRGTS